MFKNKRINYIFGLVLAATVITVLFFELMVCKTTITLTGDIESTSTLTFNAYDFTKLLFENPQLFSMIDIYWQVMTFITLGLFIFACAVAILSIIGLIIPNNKWGGIIYSVMLYLMVSLAVGIVALMIAITSAKAHTSIEPKAALFVLWSAVPVLTWFALTRARKAYTTILIIIAVMAAFTAVPMLFF